MDPLVLFYCFMGVLIGTLVGVLPGIGPIGAMSMLLPATFGMSPVASIIVLAGIYYGSQYGGSTTSILVNVPGEAPLSLPVLMVIRWHGEAGLEWRWVYRPWGPLSGVLSVL